MYLGLFIKEARTHEERVCPLRAFADKGEGEFRQYGHFVDNGESIFGDFVRTSFMAASILSIF